MLLAWDVKLIQEDKHDYASPNETMAIVGLCLKKNLAASLK